MHRTFCIAAFVIAVALSARSQAFQPQPFEFYNSYTNMCLQPIDQSTEAGKEVVQEPCEPDTSSGRAAQEWIYYPPGNDGRFMNALSGLCLDARGGAKDKTPVQQWPCNWISNEKWDSSQVNPTGGGAPVISRVSGTKSYCLDVPGGAEDCRARPADLPLQWDSRADVAAQCQTCKRPVCTQRSQPF